MMFLTVLEMQQIQFLGLLLLMQSQSQDQDSLIIIFSFTSTQEVLGGDNAFADAIKQTFIKFRSC